MNIGSFVPGALAFLGLLAAGAGLALLITAASRTEYGPRRTLRICAALVCVFMFFVLLYYLSTTVFGMYAQTLYYH